MMNREEKLRRIHELQEEAAVLLQSVEEERVVHHHDEPWPPKSFYLWYHITTGSILGGFGAVTSLLFNIVGAVITGKHPLELIRVYLTFPMGGGALTTDSDVALLIGVILYIVTGSFYGVLFEVLMAKYFKDSPRPKKFIIASVIGLGIWVVNFYGVLSWLQPLVFEEAYIMDLIPFWVAALTHLVFAWTMLLIGEWGHFEATDYKRQAMVRHGQ